MGHPPSTLEDVSTITTPCSGDLQIEGRTGTTVTFATEDLSDYEHRDGELTINGYDDDLRLQVPFWRNSAYRHRGRRH